METGRKVRRPTRRFTAAEKCRAVLSLWTERRSMSALCRELNVKWHVLAQWQEQAMAGMLQALEPKRPVPGAQTPLSARLQSLLARKTALPTGEAGLRPAPVTPVSSPPTARKAPETA